MSSRDLRHTDVRRISVAGFGSGSISVAPGTTDSVVEGELTARDESFLAAVSVRQDHDHLRIQLPRTLSGSDAADLRLLVPPGLAYDIAVGSASVSITADAGPTRVASGSGDIALGSAADLVATAGSGDVSVLALTGSAARVSTGSGDITITEAGCAVSAKSGSGDVLIHRLHRAELRASSGSGDISVPSSSGSVVLRSASGSLGVGIAEELPAWLDLDSASGDIAIELEAAGAPAEDEPFVTVRARTASGDITVYRA